MGTHALFGYLDEDGIYKLGYSSSDGYPSGLGELLLKHFNTQELAERLVNEVKELPGVRYTSIEEMLKDQESNDYFKSCEVIEYESIKELLKDYSDVEYLYIFDGIWKVYRDAYEEPKLLTNRMIYLDDNPLTEEDIPELEETLAKIAYNWKMLTLLCTEDMDRSQLKITELLKPWLP
jgi:hypothetical protein